MNIVKDWEMVKEKWKEWWNGTLDKGPIISVTAPLEKLREPPIETRKPQTLKDEWLNIEYRANLMHNRNMSTWFGGDAIPSCWGSFTNFGPGSIAGYLGSKPEFMPETIWFHELENNSLENIEKILHYDPDNQLWNSTKKLTGAIADISHGDFLTTFADIGGAMDILSSLRGNQNLLMDLNSIANKGMVSVYPILVPIGYPKLFINPGGKCQGSYLKNCQPKKCCTASLPNWHCHAIYCGFKIFMPKQHIKKSIPSNPQANKIKWFSANP